MQGSLKESQLHLKRSDRASTTRTLLFTRLRSVCILHNCLPTRRYQPAHTKRLRISVPRYCAQKHSKYRTHAEMRVSRDVDVRKYVQYVVAFPAYQRQQKRHTSANVSPLLTAVLDHSHEMAAHARMRRVVHTLTDVAVELEHAVTYERIDACDAARWSFEKAQQHLAPALY
eukprot:3921896-Pleurochrysis_carterae.AAC.1